MGLLGDFRWDSPKASLAMASGTKILAVASFGGHWVQLQRLRPAFEGHDVTFVTTEEGSGAVVDGCRVRVVTNATRRSPSKFPIMLWQWVEIIRSEDPDVIVTTGSAPGMVALAVGKLLGRRTVWIDSIANVERLSTSGRIAARVADLHLTQWQHLAKADGPRYLGSVL